MLDRNRERVKQLNEVLKTRSDINMDVAYHKITLEKARRLGTGIVPPIS